MWIDIEIYFYGNGVDMNKRNEVSLSDMYSLNLYVKLKILNIIKSCY